MATKTGTLVNDVKSPYSSPFIHYSATYTSTRENALSDAVTVTLRFKAWLQSEASTFGTGYQLKIFARLAGGQWNSVTIKDNDTAWSGTAKHSAGSLTLSSNVSGNKAIVEFYVTRDGSRLGGNSGKLGTASGPKKYTVSLPAYSGASGENTPYSSGGFVFTRLGSVWKPAVPYVKTLGVWKRSTPFIKADEIWKKGVG